MARLPDWIKVSCHVGCLRWDVSNYTSNVLRRYNLITVCEEARCPNKGSCFSRPTATFMLLGPHCTRNCGFCNVASAQPLPPDPDEPERIALAAKEMGLRYVVLTSVTRDDLPDGGASHFASTILAIRKQLPEAGIEVLTPDFKGDLNALRTVLDAGPDVFNHNIETVPRLYQEVRPQADYRRSLYILKRAKEIAKVRTKSGLMLGLGETIDEVIEVMRDLRDINCDYLTIGQYLRPSKKNLPVKEYIRPEVFEGLKEIAKKLGFKGVASGPLVRSSMNAEEMFLR